MDYWKECISEAFEDAGITATKEQIIAVASDVSGAHEYHGMYTGEENIPNPLELENERLKAELKKERERVECGECNGKGYTISYGLAHNAEFSCSRCNGEGRRTA